MMNFWNNILQNQEKSSFLITLRLLLFKSILMRNTGILLKLGYSRVISGMIPQLFVVLVKTIISAIFQALFDSVCISSVKLAYLYKNKSKPQIDSSSNINLKDNSYLYRFLHIP